MLKWIKKYYTEYFKRVILQIEWDTPAEDGRKMIETGHKNVARAKLKGQLYIYNWNYGGIQNKKCKRKIIRAQILIQVKDALQSQIYSAWNFEKWKWENPNGK